MIVIKDMEMPKSCFDCKIRGRLGGTNVSYFCNLVHCDAKFFTERHKDCPLIEVEVKLIEGEVK